MKQRTTEGRVKALCPTELTDISGPMRAGALAVNAVYADQVDEITELLERYYVAHFVALLDPREITASSGVGGLSVRYEGRMTSEGMTSYLKTVFTLDTTGKLEQQYKNSQRTTFLAL